MNDTMPALVNYAAAPRSVELREVPVPSIGDDDVLLRVAAVSVCGSDLHQWLGGASWRVNYPCVLGHEFAGVVERVGSRVVDVLVGTRVVSETAAVLDASSPFVREGRYHLDPTRLGFGYGVDGAMATFVRVPARCLHTLPAHLDFDTAALSEPCCVAYTAVCLRSTLRLGDHVVVLGPGPIGLLCGLIARLAGAGSVVVAGLPTDATRLEAARRLGLEPIVTHDLAARVRETGDGYGVDVVIDASGVSATLRTAMEVVRPGGQITKVGWGPQPMGFSLDPVVQKAVTINGTFSHHWAVWERVIGLMASGRLDVSELVSARLPLGEWEDAFGGMHDGRFVKSVLHPPGGQ
ncbi:zinc-binding dehydrogenase [soil metagenome]